MVTNLVTVVTNSEIIARSENYTSIGLLRAFLNVVYIPVGCVSTRMGPQGGGSRSMQAYNDLITIET